MRIVCAALPNDYVLLSLRAISPLLMDKMSLLTPTGDAITKVMQFYSAECILESYIFPFYLLLFLMVFI